MNLYELTDKKIKRAEFWTETDGDLANVSKERAQKIRDSRFGCIAVDYPRSELWHTPENIDVIADIPYLEDGGYGENECRGHLLDLYMPHDALIRCGKTLPVYIDIHGGGFTYGYKELNRNFNVHLAQMGFAVFSLNYRPAPQTDLKGQLADVQAALTWIKQHLGDFPVDPNAVFLTGDSAGGALTMLTLAIENNAEAAKAFGVAKPSGLHFAGGAPVCGVYSLASPSKSLTEGVAYESSKRLSIEDTLGKEFFAGLDDADPKFLTIDGLVENVDFPPLFIVTAGDDFLEADNLALAAALARKGADFEIYDPKPLAHQTLGHVFIICMTWLPESMEGLERLRDFSYDRLQ